MKRLICIPILILLIAVVCITGMININQKTDAMLETLESTRLAMEQGSYEEANRLSQTLFSQWEASEKALVYFVNSDTLDQLGYAVAQIRNLTKESQKDDSCCLQRL